MEEFGTYEGDRNHKGQPDGFGTFVWSTNGDYYEGEFKNGSIDGEGYLYYAVLSGEYTGSFREGKREGFGTLLFASGDYFAGNFLNDKFEGLGVAFYKSGDYYEGCFANFRRDGYGTMRYSNGFVYEGYWSSDRRSGIGTLYGPDNQVKYSGDWESDVQNGIGKKTIKVPSTLNTISLEGTFRSGVLHGTGIAYDRFGNSYEGEFRNEFFEGVGSLKHRTGHHYVGNFEKSTFKTGRAEHPDNSVFYGSFYNFAGDGSKVRVSYPNGDTYEGRMENGKRSGFGRLKNGTIGSVYVGDFREDKRHGDAYLVYPSGKEVLMSYREDRRIND